MHQEVLIDKAKDFFEKLKFFPDFYLVGGTALALQIGHRISVDFDLFTDKEIKKSLLPKVEKIFQGHQIEILVNNSEQLTLLIDKVKLTFFHYPFPVILEFKEFDSVKVLSIPEIAVLKAYAIGRRATFKDYIDLYFILKENYITLNKIEELADKKYQDKFNFRLFLEQLIYLKDVEDVGIQFIRNKVTKQEVQDYFQELIKKAKILE